MRGNVIMAISIIIITVIIMIQHWTELLSPPIPQHIVPPHPIIHPSHNPNSININPKSYSYPTSFVYPPNIQASYSRRFIRLVPVNLIMRN
mmetsp:Transcript_3916/g.14831  ORF Transcript_3916/g.14831 Transcript_3916/m.14831 type:complete len:91 (+) Transcript_3916:221-493(+)